MQPTGLKAICSREMHNLLTTDYDYYKIYVENREVTLG